MTKKDILLYWYTKDRRWQYLMTIKDYFSSFEGSFSSSKSELQRISVALRRENIVLMEDLCKIYRESPGEIAAIRNIGEKSMGIVTQLCIEFKEKEDRRNK